MKIGYYSNKYINEENQNFSGSWNLNSITNSCYVWNFYSAWSDQWKPNETFREKKVIEEHLTHPDTFHLLGLLYCDASDNFKHE